MGLETCRWGQTQRFGVIDELPKNKKNRKVKTDSWSVFKWDESYQVTKYMISYVTEYQCFKRNVRIESSNCAAMQELSYSQVLGEGLGGIEFVLWSDWGVEKKIPCVFANIFF